MQIARIVAIVAAAVAFVLPAVTSTKSPKDVVERFMKMDAKGLRLTPDGWQNADALFVTSTEPFRPDFVTVIAPNYQASTMTGGPDTTVFVGYEEVGKVDTALLRFSKVNNRMMKEFDKYTVVLTDAREWKIAGSQPKVMHLTPTAAMRYIEDRSTKVSDPKIKKNAAESLKTLAPFQ